MPQTAKKEKMRKHILLVFTAGFCFLGLSASFLRVIML
jgi:hypothetical protein